MPKTRLAKRARRYHPYKRVVMSDAKQTQMILRNARLAAANKGEVKMLQTSVILEPSGNNASAHLPLAALELGTNNDQVIGTRIRVVKWKVTIDVRSPVNQPTGCKYRIVMFQANAQGLTDNSNSAVSGRYFNIDSNANILMKNDGPGANERIDVHAHKAGDARWYTSSTLADTLGNCNPLAGGWDGTSLRTTGIKKTHQYNVVPKRKNIAVQNTNSSYGLFILVAANTSGVDFDISSTLFYQDN